MKRVIVHKNVCEESVCHVLFPSLDDEKYTQFRENRQILKRQKE